LAAKGLGKGLGPSNIFEISGRKIAQSCRSVCRYISDNTVVNLNDPVTVDNDALFCKKGNLLAIRFLVAARDAVLLAGAGIPQDLAWRVEQALAAMLVHRARCCECEAVELPCMRRLAGT